MCPRGFLRHQCSAVQAGTQHEDNIFADCGHVAGQETVKGTTLRNLAVGQSPRLEGLQGKGRAGRLPTQRRLQGRKRAGPGRASAHG